MSESNIRIHFCEDDIPDIYYQMNNRKRKGEELNLDVPKCKRPRIENITGQPVESINESLNIKNTIG